MDATRLDLRWPEIKHQVSMVGKTSARHLIVLRRGHLRTEIGRDERISTNVVAAFYHDQVFVPWDRRHDALQVLARFSNGGDGGGRGTEAP